MGDDRDTVSLFMKVLGVAEPVARCLVRAGITSLEEVAYVPLDELLETPGVGRDLLVQARQKARMHLAM